MRGLLNAAADALIAVGAGGAVIYVNDAATRLFGWARDELVGHPVEVLVPDRSGPDHPLLRAGRTTELTSPAPSAELWICRKDGSRFAAEISLSPFEAASIPLVAATVRDVTLARRAEQKFRAVLDSTPDATIGINAEGIIELANAQAERLFGWAADELIGQPVETLVPAAKRQRHMRDRSAYLAHPQVRPMGAGLLLSGCRRDGSEFPAEISLSPVADSEVPLVLAAIRDLTERLEAEDERRELSLAAQREQSHRLESLGQLAGGVAHDFNNLLGVILNYATLIGRNVDDAQVISDLQEIRSAAERGAALTRQLLTFARRDAVNPESVEVADVVRGVASMLSRTLGEDISLQIETALGPLITVVDPNQLEQVIVNLAINSRAAMPEGGTLTISARREPGTNAAVDDVAIRVTDTGSGMPPEVVKRAYEPFFTTKGRAEGSGLGLATVYGIVQRSGGSIAIDSTVGSGTTVIVRLPGSQQQVAPAIAENRPAAGGDARILLLEDEQALRTGMTRLLRSFGFDVVAAADGVEATTIFESLGDTIDLVLTDVSMPRMSGDEFARWLEDRGARVPVIFMSGYDSGSAPDVRRLLAKPVREDALLSLIREALDE